MLGLGHICLELHLSAGSQLGALVEAGTGMERKGMHWGGQGSLSREPGVPQEKSASPHLSRRAAFPSVAADRLALSKVPHPSSFWPGSRVLPLFKERHFKSSLHPLQQVAHVKAQVDHPLLMFLLIVGDPMITWVYKPQ